MPVTGGSRLHFSGLLPALLASLLLLLVSTHATAQDGLDSTNGVKAGFLYNFVKYTEWPNASANASGQLRVCAIATSPLAGQLALLQGRRKGNRTLDVRLRVAAGEWATCHVIYFSHEDSERVEPVLRALAGVPVLTVSDLPGFARQGGMIELVEENNRMRFEINLAATRNSGLNMSSQMLKLATRVWQ